MRVSLPDDYTEKLTAWYGNDEYDMEHTPRKKSWKWGVTEQEVYGIDPSTHNLLLDSMPAELDWSLQEKTQSFGHWICKLGILVELEALQWVTLCSLLS